MRRKCPTPPLERVLELLAYVETTGDLVWKKDVSARVKTGDKAGHVNSSGYRFVSIDGSLYPAARLAFMIAHKRAPKGKLYHLNGNRADDSIYNLSETKPKQASNPTKATTPEPRQGIETARNYAQTKGPCRGVTWNKARQKWQARITVDYVQIHLGFFQRLEDAIAERWNAEDELEL